MTGFLLDYEKLTEHDLRLDSWNLSSSLLDISSLKYLLVQRSTKSLGVQTACPLRGDFHGKRSWIPVVRLGV